MRADLRRWVVSAFLAVVVAGLASLGAYAQDDTAWQLVFEYSPTSLTLVKVSEIEPMTKAVRSPGLEGAVAVADVAARWLDSGNKELFSGAIEIPLGDKIFFDDDHPCEDYIPESGVVVVRTQGPKAADLPAAIALAPMGVRGVGAGLDVPAIFEQPHLVQMPTLDLVANRVAPPPGPVSETKIRHTGPDGNRLVIVVVGDGYTAANLQGGFFTAHAAGLLNAFLAKAPWDVYFNYTNVYRVDIESAQSGADYEDGPAGTLKDTYLNARFWTSGIERLLTINATGRTRAIAAADSLVGVGVWDDIFVLVNSTKYGGAGGSISVSSVHSAASEVILHEFGHTFANLADEYSDAYPGFPPGDPEPNVDFQFSLANLKWAAWVEPGTPLPTPDSFAYEDVVGAFVGARYLTTGIHRPWRSCLMRYLNEPFCPVCKQANVVTFFGTVQLADTFSPARNTTVDVPTAGEPIVATPLGLAGLTYTWRLNGNVIGGATGNGHTVYPSNLTGQVGPDTLQLTIGHPTSLVRGTPIAQSFTWTLISTSNTLPVAWVQDSFGGVELGTFPSPFNTFDEALEAVVPGGDIVLRSESSVLDQSMTIEKAVRIDSRDTP